MKIVRGNQMRYFVDSEGTYLGAFDVPDGQLPAGAVEVQSAPQHAAQKWLGSAWSAPPEAAAPEPSDMAVLLEALKDKGITVENSDWSDAKERLRQRK
jgi:hypothetical protein